MFPRYKFRILRTEFHILFVSVELGFRIPIVSGFQIPWAVFQIPKLRISGSSGKISRIPLYGAINDLGDNHRVVFPQNQLKG